MVTTAHAYHRDTAHSRGGLSVMGLDWDNCPSTFKVHEGRPQVQLSRDVSLPGLTLAQALDAAPGPGVLDLAGLSAALFHCAGVTRSARHGGGTFLYRACPSAGALYPCEISLLWPGCAGLEQGLYHYEPLRHGLTRLRRGGGDSAALGLDATPDQALFFISTIFFRSAWKYRVRAYRYLNLDTGHMAEGLCLALSGLGVAHGVSLDFRYGAVNGFLGLDPAREGCLCVVRADTDGAGADAMPAEPTGSLPVGCAAACRVAGADASPGTLLAAHAACSVPLRTGGGATPRPWHMGTGFDWRPLPARDVAHPPGGLGMFAAMAARRSRRGFAARLAAPGALAYMLHCLNAPLYPRPGDPLEQACRVGFLAGAEPEGETAHPPGPEPGFYLLDRPSGRMGLAREGNFLPVMAGVCLEQRWMARAAYCVLFFVDFGLLEAGLGDRGYRAALQNAGRLGQRLYLAAESLGMGACGVGAFFDVEAAEVLGLPGDVALCYAVAVGPVRAHRAGDAEDNENAGD